MYNLFIGIDGDDYICDAKETLEEYGNGVITEDFVKGRNTDNNLVLFVSDDAPAPKISGFRNVKLVASSGGMSCWEIKQ